MAAGSVSLVAVLRDARKSALLQDEVDRCVDMIRTSETQYYWLLEHPGTALPFSLWRRKSDLLLLTVRAPD
jgi:hypothetical protein